MTWVLIIGAAWVALGCLLALIVGRGIRLADRHDCRLPPLNFVVDPDAPTVPQGLPVLPPAETLRDLPLVSSRERPPSAPPPPPYRTTRATAEEEAAHAAAAASRAAARRPLPAPRSGRAPPAPRDAPR